MFVSPKKRRLSLFMPNLSALIFICSADSSPDMYNTFPSVCNLSHICSINVDFPIPGSPPSNTKDPFTKPPPNTLSNSSKFVFILVVSFFATSFKRVGVTFLIGADFESVLFTIFSSTKLLQEPHPWALS